MKDIAREMCNVSGINVCANEDIMTEIMKKHFKDVSFTLDEVLEAAIDEDTNKPATYLQFINILYLTAMEKKDN